MCGISVDPGHRDPLAGGAHQVHGLLQERDGFVDLVVDDGLVEAVGVGVLQDLRLLLQPLQGLVLGAGRGRGERQVVRGTRLTGTFGTEF